MKPVFYIIMKLFYTNFAFIANDLIIKLLINLYKNNNYNIFFLNRIALTKLYLMQNLFKRFSEIVLAY